MKYTALVQSISSTTIEGDIVAPTIKLGYGDDSQSDLFIYSLDINYSYIDFTTPGEMVIVGFDYVSPNTGTLTPPEAIQSGDLIRIFENENLIFNGYILSTTYEFINPGRMLRIEFDSLLSHFTRQNAIQTFQQVTAALAPPVTTAVKTLEPKAVPVANTDFNSNKAVLQDLIDFLMQQSVYAYAKNFSNFNVQYQKPEILSPRDFVWYYASTQSTKEEILRNAVYFFQMVIYQDPAGDLIITLPSEKDTSSYDIYDGDNNTLVTPTLRRYSKTDSQAMLPNNIVYSLIYSGFFPPTEVAPNLISQSTPDPKYFPRSYALFNSGFFSQVQLVVNSLSSDIITNPILLNLLTQTSYTIPGNSDKSQPTMTPLLSARTLAEALTSSQTIEVELNRNSSNVEIPIGKTFNLNGKAYFCIKCEISLSTDPSGQQTQNVIKLIGVPIRSITGIWSTQPFS